jgi:RNA polymerase sigma factor (TIGR02999 family)
MRRSHRPDAKKACVFARRGFERQWSLPFSVSFKSESYLNEVLPETGARGGSESGTILAQELAVFRGPAVTASPSNRLTQLLAAVGQEDRAAKDKFWRMVYDELHSLAQGQLAAETPGGTLQPTSLVHEAYLRLTVDENIQWANRRHFFAAAARAMRRIRVDDARKRKRLKRGGGRKAGPIHEGPAAFDQDSAEVLAVDEALNKLERRDPRKTEVVLLRYFTGLSVEETANALGISPRTVDNEWRFARAWLRRELTKGDSTAGDEDSR